MGLYSFQLTRSRGAWLVTLGFALHTMHFNSHAHVERDRYCRHALDLQYHFNSHAHVERDPLQILPWLLHRRYFNSHAHVERDLPRSFQILPLLYISTHTLTWSVTAVVENGGLDRDISTHTLTWSVTVGLMPPNRKQKISTHTLTWSVTIIIPP